MRLLQESMAGLPLNCQGYLNRLLAKSKLEQQYRDERASRGLDPVNLGNAARTVYSFNAVIDMPSAPPDAEREAFERSLNEQYPDSTQAPPVPVPAAKSRKQRRKISER
jgi:hypothetical protein